MTNWCIRRALLWILRKYSWNWSSVQTFPALEFVSFSALNDKFRILGMPFKLDCFIYSLNLHRRRHSLSFQYIFRNQALIHTEFWKTILVSDFTNGLPSLVQAIWKYSCPLSISNVNTTKTHQMATDRKWKSIFPIDWTFSGFDKIRLISLNIERSFWKFHQHSSFLHQHYYRNPFAMRLRWKNLSF